MSPTAVCPRIAPRHSPITAVVITSGEIDHIVGLLSMRENQSFALYVPEAVLDVLRSTVIFDALSSTVVKRAVMEPGVWLTIADLHIEPFAVPGKVAHSNGNP